MVDKTKTAWRIPDAIFPEVIEEWKGEPCNFLGLDFHADKRMRYIAKEHQVHQRGLGNMRLSILNRKLEIENSLHKLNQGGNNYEDFTYSDLLDTIDFISKRLEIDFRQSNLIGKQEFALNIYDEYPDETIAKITRYKKKQAKPMSHKRGDYGLKWYSTGYEFKVYNPRKKDFLMGNCRKDEYLNSNILRFEIAITKSYLKTKKIYLETVEDLLNTILLEKALDLIIKAASYLEFNELDYSKFTFEQSCIFYTLQNCSGDFRRQLKAKEPDKLKYREKILRKTIDESESPKSTLLNRLENKKSFLLVS